MVLELAYTVSAIIIGIVSLLYGWWVLRLRKYSEWAQLKPRFLIGNAFDLPYDAHDFYNFIQSLGKRLNDTSFTAWLGMHPMFLTQDVKCVEAILSSKTEITKSTLYRFLFEWLRTGLLTSTGAKWKNRRRTLTPTFHFSILNSFTQVFNDQAEILVKKLSKFANSESGIDVQVPIGLCALDIISETAMGCKVNAQQSESSEYVGAVLAMTGHIQIRQKNPLLWPDFIYNWTPQGCAYKKDLKILLDFTENVIAERVKRRQQLVTGEDDKQTRKRFFLDLLLDIYTKGGIDLKGIREEVDTFMFEGHDTTAAAMSWAVFLIGHNKHVQAKVHKEVDEAICLDGSALVDKIKNMKYLECCIKEALRLYPSVPLYARSLANDMKVDGKTIPAGSSVGIITRQLHCNPEYWGDDAETFRPERFLEEEFIKRNPYIYVPFSAGSRNCIGQKFAMLEEKIVCYHVFKNFQVESVQPMNDVEVCMEIITRSRNDLKVKLYSRYNEGISSS